MTFTPSNSLREKIREITATLHPRICNITKKGLGVKDEKLTLIGDLMAATIKDVNSANVANFSEEIEITTLDKFVKENNLNVGLIKVDIEGAEQDFLKGALNTIKTQKPTLLLSIYHSMDDYLSIKPFIESLNLGYRFRVYHPDDGKVMFETLLICEQP